MQQLQSPGPWVAPPPTAVAGGWACCCCCCWALVLNSAQMRPQRMQSGSCVHTDRGCNQGSACTHTEDAIRVLRAHTQRMQSGSCVHTDRGCNQDPACTHAEDAIRVLRAHTQRMQSARRHGDSIHVRMPYPKRQFLQGLSCVCSGVFPACTLCAHVCCIFSCD